MNIFFLSMSITRCARYYFDKHLIKIILEITQLLSTAHHMLDPEKASEYQNNQRIYKKTHYNHPVAVWVRLHINNYMYAAKLGLSLCDEWRFRYNHNKMHACEPKLLFMLRNLPPINDTIIIKSKNNPKCLLGPFPQAMPEDCKIRKNTVHTCVKAYRQYYKSKHKQHLVSWTKKRGATTKNMKKPPWW